MRQEIDKTIRIQGLINGLILGGVLTAVSVIYFYFMIGEGRSAISITVGSVLFSYLLPVIIAVLLCLNLRNRIGGIWTMRQAATGIFIMFFTSYLTMFIIRDQVFAKVIEPNMVQKTETAMINALNKLKESTTKPEEKKQADLKIEEMKKTFDAGKTITVGQQIQSLGISIIFLFVLSIIFAAFLKREPQDAVSGN